MHVLYFALARKANANEMYMHHKFPDEWKIASVVPLPKEGDMSQCTNYRHI